MYTGNNNDPPVPPTRVAVDGNPYYVPNTDTNSGTSTNERSVVYMPVFGSAGGTGSGGMGGMDPYTAMAMGARGSGGTGGGSTQAEGNMDANQLIALSEFLGENVTSFEYGGKMNNPYQYNAGGIMKSMMNQLAALSQINNVSKMNMARGGSFKPHMMYSPKTGEGFKASKLQDHLDMKKKGYDHRERNPDNYPKAAYGMKMKKRYTQGGRF
mgnify:FL=1